MGCWDVFCFICGNPCHSIFDSYINDIKELLKEEIQSSYSSFTKKKIKKIQESPNIINSLKELNKNTKWMNKCTMLSVDDKVQHGFVEDACNIIFCKNNVCIYHMGKWTADYDWSFYNDESYGFFIHTDCWNFIKQKYKIQLKFSDLPKIGQNKKTWDNIFDINYGDIEKYWAQDFEFAELIIDNKNYLCSSPLNNDKNIIQIKKNITALKLKNDPKRIGPLVSATFYNDNDIKLGKNNFFWINKNNKWIQINEKPITINITVNLNKLKKKQKNFIIKIPFIGQYNKNPIFIISSTKIKKNIYDLKLLLTISLKSKLLEIISESL
jgi:hypothetical protein